MHSAVARNSLTYLTALETPDRNGHQSQGTGEDSQPSPQKGGQRQQEAGTEQGTGDKRLKEHRKLCRALSVTAGPDQHHSEVLGWAQHQLSESRSEGRQKGFPRSYTQLSGTSLPGIL